MGFLRHLLWGACENDLATRCTTIRANVDNPICLFHHFLPNDIMQGNFSIGFILYNVCQFL